MDQYSVQPTLDEVIELLLPREWEQDDPALWTVAKDHEAELLSGRVFLCSELVPDWELIVAEAEGDDDPERGRYWVEPSDSTIILRVIHEEDRLNNFTAKSIMLAFALSKR